jgi:hypothetical protein
MFVISSGARNLLLLNVLKIKISRLSPRNDIVKESLYRRSATYNLIFKKWRCYKSPPFNKGGTGGILRLNQSVLRPLISIVHEYYERKKR